MDYKIYTMDGVIWTIQDAEIESLRNVFSSANARYINVGPDIMEQKGNIAIVAPVLPEDATENLYDVYLNTGTVVPVQAESSEELAAATAEFNGQRGEFVFFGGALIGPHAPQRITKHGAIKAS